MPVRRVGGIGEGRAATALDGAPARSVRNPRSAIRDPQFRLDPVVVGGRQGAPVVQGCLEKGLLVNCTHQTVLRLLPALTISDEQIDDGCDLISEVVLNLRP